MNQFLTSYSTVSNRRPKSWREAGRTWQEMRIAAFVSIRNNKFMTIFLETSFRLKSTTTADNDLNHEIVVS